MKKSTPFLILLVLGVNFISSCSQDDEITDNPETIDCSNTESVFDINLTTSGCDIDIQTVLGVTSLYSESIVGSTRNISINGIANHNVGVFPNAGNPNTIAVSNDEFSVTTNPSLSSNTTIGQGYNTAVLFSGVTVDPYTAEFFQGSNGTNTNWNITALQSTRDLGLDCNNAHVQPTGKYHYHGAPTQFIEDLSSSNVEMIKVGYAADGFPIYYKYGYADDNTTIVAYQSGYELKTTARGGDGLSAPDGCSDGYYFQDYEYVTGVSDLDECNGKTGKTPESDSEYYYIITDNFPSVPLCFSGTPNNSFKH